MHLSLRQVNSGLALSALLVVGILARSAPASAISYGDRVVERTLSNGLELILLEDHKAPVGVIQVYYRVGSRDDLPGRTGRAHLLEHMMFKGTDRLGPEEYSQIIQRNGGRTNAFTSRDRTTYFASIASDRLSVVLDLEANRMANLKISDAEYEAERQVVMEERRMRVENNPNGALFEQLYATAFQAHPYRQPIIGWMDEIRQSQAEDLREFYRLFYKPNNAFIVAVGDFVADELAAEIEKYFGGIRPGPMPPAVRTVEPVQQGERRLELNRRAQLPFVVLAHHVPNLRSADAAALDVLSQLLAGGKASRLYRELVYEQRVARYAGSDYSYSALDPNLFMLYAQPLPGKGPEVVESALVAQIERLRTEPPTETELARAKKQIEASYVFAQDSIFYQAMLLGDFEIAGDWRQIDDYLPAMRAVTLEDLARVASFYLVPTNRTVATLIPEGAQ